MLLISSIQKRAETIVSRSVNYNDSEKQPQTLLILKSHGCRNNQYKFCEIQKMSILILKGNVDRRPKHAIKRKKLSIQSGMICFLLLS